jgi:hypothetical protein
MPGTGVGVHLDLCAKAGEGGGGVLHAGERDMGVLGVDREPDFARELGFIVKALGMSWMYG